MCLLETTIDPVTEPFDGVPTRSSVLARRAALLLIAVPIMLASDPARAAASESQLEISGLTFVGSRGDGGELVLRATRAVLVPETQDADLFGVRAEVTQGKGTSFTMRCEKAQLNLETNDFSAEGDVVGVTGAGERYSAPWVRYREKDDLLFTDAPVSMVNENGHFSGDGFRYQVSERRFRLIGNVQVEQAP